MSKIPVHKPRQPRIQILALHHISFVSNENGAKPIQVSNISGSGIGLLKGEATSKLKVGDTVEGTLKTADQEIQAKLIIMQETPKILGCQFDSFNQEDIESIIETYFQLELAALNVKKVAVESRHDSPKKPTNASGQPYWFLGENNCELYFVVKDGHIQYFNLSFFGNYIEGTKGSPLSVGTVMDAEGGGVVPQEHFSASVFDAAKTFVANVETLDASHRDEIIRMLEKESSIIV